MEQELKEMRRSLISLRIVKLLAAIAVIAGIAAIVGAAGAMLRGSWSWGAYLGVSLAGALLMLGGGRLLDWVKEPLGYAKRRVRRLTYKLKKAAKEAAGDSNATATEPAVTVASGKRAVRKDGSMGPMLKPEGV